MGLIFDTEMEMTGTSGKGGIIGFELDMKTQSDLHLVDQQDHHQLLVGYL